VAPAITYAAANGARVSNHSYGAPANLIPPALIAEVRAAIQEAGRRGHLVVAMAGNNRSDNDVLPFLPGSLDLPNVIAVAATNRADHLASFSNFGSVSVDLGAPGVPIFSTDFGGKYTGGGHGTSMAAPHVTGAAALILSINPNLTFAQVKALILDNVDVVPDLVGKTVTGGRLNIFKAVAATPQPLVASSLGSGATETLTLDQVTPILAEALARWQAVGTDTFVLHGVDLRIADLGGATLGMASGNTIWLDADAAGWGWYVDPTPGDDFEFLMPGNQGEQHRMDLLTVLAHEVGHLLGYEHEHDGLMAETLSAGTRWTPGAGSDADASLVAADALFALLAAEEERAWMGNKLFGRRGQK
jgi:subtilisin family serine protease